MPQPLFQLDAVLNRKLYLSLQKAYFRQFRQGYRRAWVAAALALAAVAGLFARSGDSLGWVYVILALLAIYAALWGWHLPALWNLTRMKKQLGKKVLFAFWDFGLECTGPGGEQLIPWREVTHVLETPEGWGLLCRSHLLAWGDRPRSGEEKVCSFDLPVFLSFLRENA